MRSWKIIGKINNFCENLEKYKWFSDTFSIFSFVFVETFCHPPQKNWIPLENRKNNHSSPQIIHIVFQFLSSHNYFFSFIFQICNQNHPYLSLYFSCMFKTLIINFYFFVDYFGCYEQHGRARSRRRAVVQHMERHYSYTGDI